MAADRYAFAAIVVCEGAATVALSMAISPWLGAAVAGILGLIAVRLSLRRGREAPSQHHDRHRTLGDVQESAPGRNPS
jgi:hypothetical protein